MNINDKIKQILIDKNYSPSYFADEIGVQRSSISHILSGRNRPSFDIIQKIIRRFPDLGYEWIMEEDTQYNPVSTPRFSQGTNTAPPTNRYDPSNSGSVQRTAPVPTHMHRSPRQEIAPSNPAKVLAGDDSETSLAEPSVQPTIQQPQAESGARKVERILIFYTDGSFREYMPSAS